jgi:hypothetical protein
LHQSWLNKLRVKKKLYIYNLKKQKKRVKIMVYERGFHRYINQTRKHKQQDNPNFGRP